MNIRQTITHNLLNIPGWRTNRHIVVIESDDWGSIRMPSKEVYDKLLKEGYRVDLHPYEKYDSLASEDDLSGLFEVLSKYSDRRGRHPIITANCAVANPDFDKIEQSEFTQYYYEPFTTTLKRYNGCKNSFELWQQGIKNKVFMPQFHAREHLNVARWLDVLRNGDADNIFAFKQGMIGIFPKKNHKIGNIFQVALDNSKYEDQPIEEIISEGLTLFEKLFGFKSKTFIAPCYTWSPEIEKVLNEKGVSGLQGMVYQSVPGGNHIKHWMGTKNQYGQVYMIRNAFFEPSLRGDNHDEVNDCLYRIKCAFRWNKPAIISAHRINFIGAIHGENRDMNLKSLSVLLSSIIRQWPDVEFMSSDELCDIIINSNENSIS